MRKIIFGMIGLLLAGCSSDNMADFPGTGDDKAAEPVTFATYTGKSRTRANTQYFVDGIVNSTIPRQTSVGIFAWSQKDGDTWTSWTPDNNFDADFMFNQPATAQTVQNGVAELSYSPTRYWPKDMSKQFAFFAYYPFTEPLEDYHVKDKDGNIEKDENGNDKTSYSASGINLAQSSDLTDKGIKKFHFYVQPTPEKQVDFLVSDYVINYNGTGKDPVRLNFRHTLSQVSISIQLDETMQRNGARIDESTLDVSLTNAYGEGDLTVTPNANGRSTLSWATSGERRNFKTNPTSLSSTTDSRSAILIMIPQKIDGISLSVTYDINFYEVDDNGDLVVDDRGNPKELYSYKNNRAVASLANARDWEAGQRFIYNVAVGLQGISVTPEVVDWYDAGSTSENL